MTIVLLIKLTIMFDPLVEISPIYKDKTNLIRRL